MIYKIDNSILKVSHKETKEDPYAKLTEMIKLLDAGVITQADFDAVKNKLLGI